MSILQAIFPKRAWLKSWTSRRPRPPKILGLVSLSHASQQIFLSPLLLSHQKRISTDCIWLHNPTCSWKQDIAKEKIAERTNCSIVSFHVVERNLVDHPRAFCFIRLTMEAKRSFSFCQNVQVNSSTCPLFLLDLCLVGFSPFLAQLEAS